MLEFCELLEKNPLIMWLAGNIITSTILEVCHYSGFFLLIGASVVLDLRLMGIAARREPVSQLASQLRPMIWTGLVMVLVSGFLMFAGDAVEFWEAETFKVKLLVVLIAALFGMLVYARAAAWSEQPSISLSAKFVAVLSIALWIGSILVSVEVPAISGVS